MNESEKRVKEVWPDAKVICGPENCNGHQIVLPISGDGWGAEFGAWADAASRLPEAEVDTSESAAHPALKDAIYAMIAEVAPPPLVVSETAVAQLWPLLEELRQRRSGSPTEQEEPVPQTFEEWRNRHWYNIDWLNSEIRPIIKMSDVEAGWNAAKASSPVVAGGESETEK